MKKKLVFIASLILNILLISYLSYRTYVRIVVTRPDFHIRSNPETDGYVPDSLTAIGIAKAIWLPIYGKDHIERHSPFDAGLLGDTIWRITGSRYRRTLNDWELGGSLFLDIHKTDGKVTNSGHSK